MLSFIQHAINPGDMRLTIKRATKCYVDRRAPANHQKFQAEHLQLQQNMLNVRWAVGTKPADLIAVVKGVYSNYHTIRYYTSITDIRVRLTSITDPTDPTRTSLSRC